ncbi:MAG TPA: DUF2341 domain-containing protein [Ideonella sp.]|uniref:DUF2341 domain-containing protein n=1 Tax=Ideonella sp. TaxID=1929293 RepID=UPI002D027AAB|nr:DUF2341 domain-containing protein [Ideonella sp.]HSI47457.1 DUF2341 domain-containing protein [Ideonella sp.]
MIRQLLTALALSTALAAPAHAWWDDAWTTRTKVELDTTAKGLALPSAQANVLVPVRLHSGNFDFAAALPDGADLRVVGADDKTPLPFDIERFDAINELAVLWVRMPSVAQGSDKNLLHVYAGNDKAAAEAKPGLFAADHAAVLHFSEAADGPAHDAASNATSTGPMQREPNGLLGGAVRLAGTPLSFGPNTRLVLAPEGGLTIAMWLKPDAPTESSTLLALGPVKLLRTVDQLEARIGDEKLGGAALPGSAWSHVVLTVGQGKAQLYINGKPVSQADALLPAAATPAMVLGEGYKGLVDELQILPAARDAGWVRLAAAAQGMEGSFIRSQKESADGGGESGGGGYFGILLKNLTGDAWAVIGVLIVMFFIAAAVMVTKAMLVSRVGRDNERFLERFRADFTGQGLKTAGEFVHSTLYRLYATGEAEIAKRRERGMQTLTGASLNSIKATMDAVQVRENHVLNARMVLLTIAISGGPFLGLLGTVVGVMITFAAIAAAGDVNVNAIAPGIAAALLATVAGLGVAIPALFGYNWLASRIKTISADMQIFVDEFVTRAAELHGPQ